MPDAARYHRLQLVLAAAGLALSTAYLLAALLMGAAHALAGAAAAATATAWGQVAIVAGVLAGAHALLTFPLAWTRGWWLPRRYGRCGRGAAGGPAGRAAAAVRAGAPGVAGGGGVAALRRAPPVWGLGARAVCLAASGVPAFGCPIGGPQF